MKIKPYNDPIVAEIHRHRRAILASFNGDIDALIAAAQAQTEASGLMLKVGEKPVPIKQRRAKAKK